MYRVSRGRATCLLSVAVLFPFAKCQTTQGVILGRITDAVLQEGGKVLLRAERAGTGNGRVYHVTFMADDGSGGQCTGVVTVCAPHDQGEGNACIDDGQQYNSLQP